MGSTIFPHVVRSLIGVVCFSWFGVSVANAFQWHQFEFIPRWELQEKYDSNVTYLTNNAIDDWITDIVTGVSFKHVGKTHFVELDATVSLQLFAKKSSFHNLSEDIFTVYNKQLSPYDLIVLKNTFINATEPRSFEAAFGRIKGKYFTLTNFLELEFQHDLSRHFIWKIGYGNEIQEFTTASLSGSNQNSITTGIDYTPNSATLVGLEYRFSRRQFSFGTFATINQSTLQFRRFLTTQLYADLKVGLGYVTSYSDGHYFRPLYSVALINDLDETTRGKLLLEKDYSNSAYAQDFLDQWKVSLVIENQTTNRLKAHGSLFYGTMAHTEYDEKERFFGLDMGSDYDLTSMSKLRFRYIYTKNNSSFEFNSYSKNVLQLSVVNDF